MDTEFIKFTLYQMPCCHIMICWVNPRIPNYCPECGKRVYMDLKFHPEKHVQFVDDNAKILHKCIYKGDYAKS